MARYRVLQLLLLVSGMTSQVIGMMPSEKSSTIHQIEKTTSEEVSSNMPFTIREIGEGIAQRIEELPKEVKYIILSLALELRENQKYEVYKKLDVGSGVRGIALNGDTTKVLSGSDNGTIYIWDLEKRRVFIEFKGHTDSILSVALSVDDNIALTSSRDGTVLVWNSNTGELIKNFHLGFCAYVTSVALSADGALALTGSRDGIARLYNTSTGELLKKLKGHTKSITSVALSADGSIALISSVDETILIWNTNTERLIKSFEAESFGGCPVALSADGITAVIGYIGKVLVWDVKAGILLNTLLTKGCVYSVAVSKDGKRVLTNTPGDEIQVWNTQLLTGQKETNTPLTVLKGYAGEGYPVAFGDNDFIASGLRYGTFTIWKPFALKPQEPRENKEVLWQAYKEIFSKPKFLYPDKK